MEPKVKTINTLYTVRVNNNDTEKFNTIWEAKRFIASLVINDDINEVSIMKQTTQETCIKKFQTKTAKILVSTDLDNDLLQGEQYE